MFLSGCSNYFNQGNLQKAGMLVETSIHDKPWNKKGYQGLLEIEEEFNTDVYFKEGIQTEQEIGKAVDELVNQGVNQIGRAHV